jgi:hypothetical protein
MDETENQTRIRAILKDEGSNQAQVLFGSSDQYRPTAHFARVAPQRLSDYSLHDSLHNSLNFLVILKANSEWLNAHPECFNRIPFPIHPQPKA